MHFIGVFANNSEFEFIKRYIIKILKRKDIEFININSNSISNIKNVVFETILICGKINISDKQKEIINSICSKCKYIIINADICSNTKIISSNRVNCITYGLNQKSTITISSIQDEKAIIYIQRNIKNVKENEIEMGEICINLKKHEQIKIENLLSIFSIYLLYKE